MIRSEYQIEFSAYIKTKAQYESRCAQVYHLIWSKCTVAMRNAVKQDPDFARWDPLRDALSLWLCITNISLNGTVVESAAKRIQEARHRWDRFHQKMNEPVGEFYDRFQEHYEAMTSQGAFLIQPLIPPEIGEEALAAITAQHTRQEEEIKAMNFLNKLDRTRFGKLLDELQNADRKSVV